MNVDFIINWFFVIFIGGCLLMLPPVIYLIYKCVFWGVGCL